MKIRCDVCDQAEASVFCSADEAALCDWCDRRVHHANKLASKHLRFSLLQPNSLKEAPLCDICQERRAFLFCREDRAILCRECDIPIHKANEHTQKHNRFLLTGVRLSASSSSYPTMSASSTSGCDENSKPGNINARGSHSSHQPPSSLRSSTTAREAFSSLSGERVSLSSVSQSTEHVDHHNHGNANGSVSTSSISEYLETLPGWRVDDLLDPSFASYSLSTNKTCEPNLQLVARQDLESYWSTTCFSPEGLAFWVPHQVPLCFSQAGLLEEAKEANGLKVARKWNDDGFAVPQISPDPPSVKKLKFRPLVGQ